VHPTDHRTRRRTLLATAATGLLLLLGTALGASSAVAGGPTSVLLVVPGENRTASLYTGSADYDRLITLVGGFEPPTGSTTPPKGADDLGAAGTNDSSGPGVTLTWLIHDVNVWRVDRVYADAAGGPLISTQTSANGGDLWATPPVWHTAARGAQLTDLLDRLGVGPVVRLSTPTPAAGTDPATPRAVDPTANRADAAAAPDARAAGSTARDGSDGNDGTNSTDGFDGNGWLWGPVGLALGAAATLAVTRRPR
jgi:hypothetical protein